MTGWETVKIPEEMLDKIDKFTRTQLAKEIGYTSRSQAVIAALREFLLKYKGNVTFYLKSPKHGKLEFKKSGPIIMCVKCKDRTCEHAIFLFRNQKQFDFDLIENGEILAGTDFDKEIDIGNPQPL